MLHSNSAEFEQAVRGSLLAMAARSFAVAQFADEQDLLSVTVTITRSLEHENPVDVDLVGRGGVAIGGMSL